MEKLDALRAEAREGGDLAEFARQLPLQRIQQREMSGFDDLRDLAGQVLADTGKLRQIASGREQAFDALRQAFDGARGAPIGAHAKLIFSLDFKEFCGLIEHRRDFRILHRHGQRLHAGRLYRASNPCNLMQIRTPLVGVSHYEPGYD